MVHQPLVKLPIIDLSNENLKQGTSSWSSKTKEIIDALENFGCFEAIYNKVSLRLHHEIFGALKDLFDLPIETKMKNTSITPFFGYVGKQPFVPPLHESMGIENANTLQGVQSFTSLMWPAGNDLFSEYVLEYSKSMSELEQIVKKMVFEGYGVEKYYEPHMEKMTYLLRAIKYRVPEENETKLGCNVHTDKSFITILHQNDVNGLEIQTKNGEWIGVQLSSSSFIVMAGDAFLAWSNGRIHSAKHQVVINGNETRYSLALFSYVNGIVQIPHQLADHHHPMQFKPFDHFGLVNFFFTNDTNQNESTAKAYCGIGI